MADKWKQLTQESLNDFDFPEELKDIILKFGFAFRNVSEKQTEIIFNKSKINDVRQALSKSSLSVTLDNLNGHSGFNYPKNHNSKWIKFRSTGLSSLSEDSKSITRTLGVNIDDARELGVAICAVLVYNRISKSQFLEDNYNKKIRSEERRVGKECRSRWS